MEGRKCVVFGFALELFSIAFLLPGDWMPAIGLLAACLGLFFVGIGLFYKPPQ